MLCLLMMYVAKAQESMIPDVSFTYLDKLVALAKENYPKVKMYAHKETRAKANINKAALSWFDILTFTYLYSNNNTPTLVNPTVTNGYQFGVYFNAGNLATKPAGVRVAREDYRVAKEDLNEYYLNLEAEVKRRYYEYIKSVTVMKIRAANAVDVESTARQLKYKFEKGEGTLLDYNVQLTSLTNAIQLKIEAEAAMLTAKSGIEELIGVKMESVK